MHPTEHSITEDDIANFLANTPDFFERHAELLSTVQLSSGHGSRAVSLQERQAGMLREKIKGLETRVVDMIRHGHDNGVIADKLQHWTQKLLQTAEACDLPGAIVAGIIRSFDVPQASIKFWEVNSIYADQSFARGVSDDARIFALSLNAPYCGVNSGFEAVNWLADPAAAQSVALIPLRTDAGAAVAGLLVLASPDAERFKDSIGTDFLERLGALSGAALSRLRPLAAGQ